MPNPSLQVKCFVFLYSLIFLSSLKVKIFFSYNSQEALAQSGSAVKTGNGQHDFVPLPLEIEEPVPNPGLVIFILCAFCQPSNFLARKLK